MADFRVRNHGSICILTGMTAEARAWLEERVGDDETQAWGAGIVVESRYIDAIVDGIQNDGFSVGAP